MYTNIQLYRIIVYLYVFNKFSIKIKIISYVYHELHTVIPSEAVFITDKREQEQDHKMQ